MISKHLGNLGELLVAAMCAEHGLAVFRELGDSSRIDLIVEDHDSVLHKVQVKCLNRANGAIGLKLQKAGPNGYRYTYSPDDIDWFAVVDVESKRVAWIHAKEACTRKTVTFRCVPSLNNQESSVRQFDDYTDFPFS